VDGEAMYITASLDSALRHMRDRYRKRQVWADAICINQDDIEERNHQVGQMASVYSHAHHTIIFLGEGIPETTRFLDDLQSNASKHEDLVSGSRASESPADLGSNIEEPALQWILSRPWFRRVWILQELVLSKDPWIQCGTSLARWGTLRRHITASGREPIEQEKLFLSMSDLHLEHLNKVPTESDGIASAEDTAERLLNLLLSRKGFGVSDPRDMLFANVGLLPKPRIRDDLLHHREVNYEKDEVQVYIGLALYFIGRLDDTVIWLMEGDHRLVKNLPSWVPDWTSPPDPLYVRLIRRPVWRTRSTPWEWRPLISASDSHILATAGVVLGKVSKVGHTIKTTFQPRIFKEICDLIGKQKWEKLELWKVVGRVFKERYRKWKHIIRPTRDPQRVISAFNPHLGFPDADENSWTDAECLLVGSISNSFTTLVSNHSGPNSPEKLSRITGILERWWECPPRTWGGESHIQSLLSHMVFSSLLTTETNIFYSRKFALLDDDSIALVPASTQIGDVVALQVYDFDRYAPMVLRPFQGEMDPLLDAEIKQRDEHIVSVRYGLDEGTLRVLSEPKEVDHFTLVGECFVEGDTRLRTHLLRTQHGPVKLLALN
jgi:hypothetical protein